MDVAGGAGHRAPSTGPGIEDGFVPLSPQVIGLWRLQVGLASLVAWVAAIIVAVALPWPAGARVAAVVAVAGIGVVATTLGPSLVYRRWRYAVTEQGIELRHGVVVHHESSIPHFRVQHVDLEQGPLDRWRGIVKLRISTASSATDASLPGLEPERAELVRRRVLARTEADDAV